MKFYADKKRVDRSFEVGDEVYLKLQPFRQNSVALRRNLKLAPEYYGPFRVMEKVGSMAYKLQLPMGSSVHPVFHVSLLKKKISQKHIPSPDLPLTDANGVVRTQPLAILEKRTVKRGEIEIPQVLVQWTNGGPSLATWEDCYDVATKFPEFDPWGQGSGEGGGNVTSLRVENELGFEESGCPKRMTYSAEMEGTDDVKMDDWDEGDVAEYWVVDNMINGPDCC